LDLSGAAASLRPRYGQQRNSPAGRHRAVSIEDRSGNDPTDRKSSECLHRRDQLVPVQQIADAFLTLLEFLAAAARAWIAFISVGETLIVSSDQNL
jgi:hypothetical protein